DPITTTELPPPPPPPPPRPSPSAPFTTTSTTATSLPPSTIPSPRPLPSPVHGDGDSPPEVPDLLFLVDASGSMKSAWNRHLQCVSTIARPAVGRAKIGVIVYSSRYKHRLYIPFRHYDDAATLDSMINALPFHGGVTNTGEALNEAVRVLEKERPRRVAVITLTDGYSWDALDRGSAQIRAFQGTTTYAVALEDVILRSELKILAESAERMFIQGDCCERLAHVLSAGSEFRKNTESITPPENPSTYYPESTPLQSSNRYSSGRIGNEQEAHAQFDDGLFVVDGSIADEAIARFGTGSDNRWIHQQNNLPIPRRAGLHECSLDVVFAFDSTSRAGLPSLLAASQILLHSRVFKRRTVRIGAVKFSEGMYSRVVFPLDEASRVPLEDILKSESHRGVEQALFLAAALLRDATPARPTKRVVI
ncbi:hypothetical protein PENTCL1PPCAC_28926, partial [Pristionchus entomophagus]